MGIISFSGRANFFFFPVIGSLTTFDFLQFHLPIYFSFLRILDAVEIFQPPRQFFLVCTFSSFSQAAILCMLLPSANSLNILFTISASSGFILWIIPSYLACPLRFSFISPTGAEIGRAH